MENNLTIVNTCGVCEEICEADNLKNHSCLEGYNNYYIDENTLYFYPLLDDGITIVRRSAINNEEQLVAEPFKQVTTLSKRTPISKLSFDEEEILIMEVQNRPALWNYTLPLKERSVKRKKQLWKEVAQALNEKFSAEVLKVRFKGLHDTFRKIIQSEHQASGSARHNNRKKWAHYDSMTFLRDNCLLKNTVSNIENEENERESCSTPSTSTNISNDSFIVETEFGKRRKRNHDDAANAINRIAEAICQPNTLTLPPPPQTDDVDSFLIAIGHHLRKLPTLIRIQIIQQFLQITYEALSKI